MNGAIRRWLLGAVLSLALGTCGDQPSAKVDSSRAAVTPLPRPSPTASATPLAMIRVVPTPTIAPPAASSTSAPLTPERATPTPEPQESLGIQMFTPTTGWGVRRRAPVLMADGPTAWTILRTTDGGAHWRDASPSDAPREARAGMSFLGPNDAWLLLPSDTSGTLTLFHTTDAGATWRRSSLRTPYKSLGYGSGGAQFLDPLHGWLLVRQHDLGMLTGPAVLYRTVDGGGTWTLISSTDSRTLGHLPFPGGMTFRTPTIGWLAGSNAGTGPELLYSTHDGGATWQPESLPLPPGDQGTLSLYASPTLFLPRRDDGYFTAQFIPADHDQAKFALLLYITRDGGMTWSPRVFSHRGDVTFIDANDGWIWAASLAGSSAGGTLYRTLDGGATWSVVAPSSLRTSLLQAGDDFGGIEFVTPQVGWAWVFPSGQQSTELLRTKDSGMTWVQIYGPNGS